MSAHASCRICTSDLPAPFFDFGSQPLANNLLSDPTESCPTFPLSLTRCRACHLVQLTEVVPSDLLFLNYLYTPDQSATFHRHFLAMARELQDAFSLQEGALVVDIGSNTGLLLSYFKQQGMRVVGVEPARNLVAQSRDRGVTTFMRYFTMEAAELIIKDHGHPSLITATNVFAHVDDVLAFGRAVERLLDEEGVFVLEVPSLRAMIESGSADLVYHEHLSYWSLHTIRAALIRCGLAVFDAEELPIHGGSLRVCADKAIRRPTARFSALILQEQTGSYASLPAKAVAARHRLRSYLLDHKGQSVVGCTAPAKATVLLNYCGLTGADIAWVADDSSLKQGKYIPTSGKPVPIVDFSRFSAEHPDVAIIFSWNLRDELAEKIRGLCGEIVVPIPEFSILS